MENGKKNNKIVKTIEIIGILLSVIFYCFSLLGFCKLQEKINIGINIVSAIIFCILLIPLFCDTLLDLDENKKSYCISFHLIFLLPFGMFGHYNKFESLWIRLIIIICITIVTIFLSLYIYKKLKRIDIKHVKNLKFKNLLLTTLFSILFPIFGLIKDINNSYIIMNIKDKNNLNIIDILNLLNNKVEVLLFLTCITPLLFLQIIYEKILLEDELNKNKGHSFVSDTTFQVRFRV